jgi:hypothetical protein
VLGSSSSGQGRTSVPRPDDDAYYGVTWSPGPMKFALGTVPKAKPLGEALDQEQLRHAQLSFGSAVYLSWATSFEEQNNRH